MNRNKNTKNVKYNKAIENMDSTNDFDILKPMENKENTDANIANKKKDNNLF